MDSERIELAVQRIEAALARIGAVADQPAPEAFAGRETEGALQAKHEALRSYVEDTVAELDQLIGKLSA